MIKSSEQVMRRIDNRFSNPKQREWWGYAVWGIAVVVMLVPEISAAANLGVPWPTISATVGHLEYQHSWVALVVVGLIVGFAYQWVRYPSFPAAPAVHADGLARARSSLGRLTARTDSLNSDDRDEFSVATIFVSLLVVASGSFLASLLNADRFVLAYVLYGLFALCFAVIPSTLAYRLPRDVPYPTFYRTVANLDHRFHLLAVLVVIGFVILLIHLSLYPWPGVFHQLQNPNPGST